MPLTGHVKRRIIPITGATHKAWRYTGSARYNTTVRSEPRVSTSGHIVFYGTRPLHNFRGTDAYDPA